MIVQGLAPSFWGPLSDTQGRRVTFIGGFWCNLIEYCSNISTGTFVVYLIANVGLVYSNSFASLMVLRGIQAAGSAATISVGKSNPSLPAED
jgi:MFS family permease